jgi:predicted HicB family RNase H-like nuclease
MKMSLIVGGICSDVVSIGELGDETVAEVAERIAALLGRSLPGRVLDLLSDVAGELTGELVDAHVEVRVAGDDVELVSVDDVAEAAVAPRADAAESEELSARITLRLSDQLKARVEKGAADEGLSVNTYVVRLLDRGVSTSRSGHGTGRVAGSRLRGFGTT